MDAAILRETYAILLKELPSWKVVQCNCLVLSKLSIVSHSSARPRLQRPLLFFRPRHYRRLWIWAFPHFHFIIKNFIKMTYEKIHYLLKDGESNECQCEWCFLGTVSDLKSWRWFCKRMCLCLSKQWHCKQCAAPWAASQGQKGVIYKFAAFLHEKSVLIWGPLAAVYRRDALCGESWVLQLQSNNDFREFWQRELRHSRRYRHHVIAGTCIGQPVLWSDKPELLQCHVI